MKKGFGRIFNIYFISLLGMMTAGCGMDLNTGQKTAHTPQIKQSGVTLTNANKKIKSDKGMKTLVSTIPSTRTIKEENSLPGTTSWRIKNPANGIIQGYASKDSVNAGGKINFYVSTRYSGTPYTIKIFRLGYYQGKGGRLVQQTKTLTGLAQGWWSQETGGHHLVSVKGPTGYLQLKWKPSYQLTIPYSWVSGYYMVLLTTSQGYQSYIPFTVRDDQRPHKLLIDVPVNTWEAYNYWGDYSFYGHYGKFTRRIWRYRGNNAIEVSFNRPYDEDNGAGLALLEFPSVYWLESQGYDVSYTTSTAMDQSKTEWTPKAMVSLAHDEYWSAGMVKNTSSMLKEGVNFAFLGANDMYWRIRYKNNDRTMVGYRWEMKDDPYRKTPKATGGFRFLGAPESDFLGEMYAGQPYKNPDWYVSNPKSWVFHGLNVYKGEKVPGIIGWEFDSAISAHTPIKDLSILSKTPVVDRIHHMKVNYMTTTIYKAPSGAYVFDAGTIWWGYGLANPLDYKFSSDTIPNYDVPYYNPPSPIIQGVTRNVLNRFINGNNIIVKKGDKKDQLKKVVSPENDSSSDSIATN